MLIPRKFRTMKLLKKDITTKDAKRPMKRNNVFPFANPLRLTLLLLLIGLPILGMAQQPDSTHSAIDRYLEQAAENNPELKAQFQKYLSALQQVPQVNTLPDPELSFGYFISPIETRVGPQQARFGVTQMFPWFGTLGAREQVATQVAKAKFEAFQDRRNELFYQVHKQWYELYQIEQSIGILRENIEILETFESVATQRYENNQVGQVDVLRVQIEKEDLKTRLELLKDNKTVAIQEFNELLNRAEEKDVNIPDTLSSKELEMAGADLEQAVLQQNPNLAELDYQASSARGSVKAARKEGLPKFGVGFDYVMTGQRNIVIPDNGQDAIMGRVRVKVPLYRKKYRAKVRQAQIELNMVQSRRTAEENRLQTTLEQALRDYYDGERRVALYKEVQIQRTRQAINILTEQYATGDTDFEELLRLQRKLLDYELSQLEAVVDQNSAAAQIERLYGKYNVNPEEIEIQ